MIPCLVVALLVLVGAAPSNGQPRASVSQGQSAAVAVISHTPPVRFVSFVDPKEKAFTVEVPQGWEVRGGLFRFAAVDTRPALELVSPDGAIRIRSGDAEIPTFTLPSQTLALAGFVEGAWYSPGYGVRMMVRRYLTGSQFAEEYVRSRVLGSSQCSNENIVGRQERRDLSQAVNELYQGQSSAMGVVHLDLGEVRFACTRNGEAWQGYYLAGTLLMAAQAGGIWHVDHLVGYAAARAKARPAEAILLRVIGSARVNPEWARMQQDLAADTSQIVANTNTALASSIRKTFEKRWSSEAEVARKGTNMRRGTTDLMDPDTGETWNVRSQSSYFWRKPGSDVIVGTESPDAPGMGFQALVAY